MTEKTRGISITEFVEGPSRSFVQKENVTVNVPAQDYEDLAKLFKSRNVDDFYPNRTFDGLFEPGSVKIGKRQNHSNRKKVEPKYYTYKAQLSENRLVNIRSNDNVCYEVGLNYDPKKESKCINFEIKIAHERFLSFQNRKKFSERDGGQDFPEESFILNIHLQPTATAATKSVSQTFPDISDVINTASNKRVFGPIVTVSGNKLAAYYYSAVPPALPPSENWSKPKYQWMDYGKKGSRKDSDKKCPEGVTFLTQP